MVLLRCLNISLEAFTAFLGVLFLSVNAYSGGDLFYDHLVRQRMLIAAIKEWRSESGGTKEIEAIPAQKKMEIINYNPGGQLNKPWEQRGDNQKFSAPGNFDSIINQAARRYSLPSALIKAIVRAESNFVPHAVSQAGARGLMQLMPDTARKIGVRNPFGPWQNILGGTQVLRSHLDEFGSVKQALTSYNCGPERVRKGQSIPEETKEYVKRVIFYYQIYKGKK